jgi:hypothetical protein
VYEQSSNNLFAFNSATHSGDGFFLWAGQSTMDTGEGGCNDNLIFGNDFSHAPTNGVEVTFSRNTIAGNYITDCTHGIWGGYSYGTNIFGNLIANCRTAIAIEHGQNDTIRQNLFEEDSIGIHLWARAEQPADWPYAKKRDTRSRDNLIDRNVFLHVRRPLKIAGSQNVAVNGLNLFFDFTKLLETPQPNEKLTFVRNDVYGTYAQTDAVWAIPALAGSKNVNSTHNQEPSNPYAPLEVLVSELREPDSLPDGMLAALPPDHPRGRQYIIVDEWGPYDFRRPVAVLKNLWTRGGREMYRLQLLGPSGNWRTTTQEGIQNLVGTYGQMPAEVTFERTPGAAEVRLEFEFTSIDTITTVLGQPVPPREPYRFAFERFEKKLDWQVMFYNYTDTTDPLLVPNAFATFRQQRPVLVKPAGELYFAWWGKPAEGVQEDKFATISRASFEIEPGEYRIELTSDDGARLYLDGKRLIDNWDVHEPETDEVTVTLGGRHTVEVEHFEAGGFSTLDFRIKKVR